MSQEKKKEDEELERVFGPRAEWKPNLHLLTSAYLLPFGMKPYTGRRYVPPIEKEEASKQGPD